jgi:hypothetical protein
MIAPYYGVTENNFGSQRCRNELEKIAIKALWTLPKKELSPEQTNWWVRDVRLHSNCESNGWKTLVKNEFTFLHVSKCKNDKIKGEKKK